MYSWVDFHREYFEKVLQFDARREELNILVSECFIKAVGKFNYPWKEMDPFSPISMSSQYGFKKRIAIYQNLKEALGLGSPVPDDFDGVPVLSYLSRFVPDETKEPDALDRTWSFFKTAMMYAEDSDLENQFVDAFDKEIMFGIQGPKISMALFWMRPDKFCTFDETMHIHLSMKHGYEKVKKKFTGQEYLSINHEVESNLDGWGYNSFIDLSASAWNKRTEDSVSIYPDYDPGITVEQWKDLLQNPDVFNQERLQFLKTIVKNGGSASCRQLSKCTGETAAHFTGIGNALNMKVAEATGCATTLNENMKTAFWPILFKGIDGQADEDGFTWTLRDELKSAIDQLGLFEEEETDTWIMSLGKNNSQWPRCRDKDIISLGWDELGYFENYSTQADILSKLSELCETTKNQWINSRAVYDFTKTMKIGDRVLIKDGRNKLIALGVVKSSVQYDETERGYRNYKDVEWVGIDETGFESEKSCQKRP